MDTETVKAIWLLIRVVDHWIILVVLLIAAGYCILKGQWAPATFFLVAYTSCKITELGWWLKIKDDYGGEEE